MNINRTFSGVNAVKRQRPNISPDDIKCLLFHMEDARDYLVKYGAAQGIHSPKAAAETVTNAIDELTRHITGNRKYFWAASVSATGDERIYERALEKAAKRRRLMGIHFPLRALKVQ
jgi:hypothetical protein